MELRFKEALDPKKVQIIIFRITVRPGSAGGTASRPKGGLARGELQQRRAKALHPKGIQPLS